MSAFEPTHRITFVSVDGTQRTFEVALDANANGFGPAYTQQEWEQCENADWEVRDDGRWYCLGQTTPGGASGTVTIKRVRA